MIDYISGVLQERGDDYIVLETNGIGYKVNLPGSFFAKLPAMGEFTKVYTHLVHKEDLMELIGFITLKDRELFRHLITVSGIGSKLGMKILSDIPANELIRAILNKDSKYLTKVSGLGTKGAEKIILELEGKFRKLYLYPVDSKKDELDEYERTSIEALLALGYKEREAVGAVSQVIKKGKLTSPEEIIKSCLKILAKI